MIEKPFGSDEKSATKLDMLIKRTFKENQIYRIDHYLGKEMLQNVWNFRVSHELFGKEWSEKTIKKIEIRLLEKIGVEDRGAFYDCVGALREMGQSHILQMLALTVMNKPKSDSHASYRAARAEVFAKLGKPRDILRAQYLGYRSINGVATKSETETYFKVCASLQTANWKSVPIIMESGKQIGETRKEIEVLFKSGKKILFQLEPEEAVFIDGVKILIEKSGVGQDAYQKIISNCIAGDQTIFVSSSETKYSWKFTDKIIRAWRVKKIPLKTYRAKTQNQINI
jgi:glucose-6-phosphate 1-dehydrogenase